MERRTPPAIRIRHPSVTPTAIPIVADCDSVCGQVASSSTVATAGIGQTELGVKVKVHVPPPVQEKRVPAERAFWNLPPGKEEDQLPNNASPMRRAVVTTEPTQQPIEYIKKRTRENYKPPHGGCKNGAIWATGGAMMVTTSDALQLRPSLHVR